MSAQRVEEYLAQSGKASQLSSHLQELLERSGWYDSVSTLAAEKLSVCEEPDFNKLLEQVEGPALAMVPEEIRTEMLQLITRIVDEAVEH